MYNTLLYVDKDVSLRVESLTLLCSMYTTPKRFMFGHSFEGTVHTYHWLKSKMVLLFAKTWHCM